MTPTVYPSDKQLIKFIAGSTDNDSLSLIWHPPHSTAARASAQPHGPWKGPLWLALGCFGRGAVAACVCVWCGKGSVISHRGWMVSRVALLDRCSPCPLSPLSCRQVILLEREREKFSSGNRKNVPCCDRLNRSSTGINAALLGREAEERILCCRGIYWYLMCLKDRCCPVLTSVLQQALLWFMQLLLC